MFQHSIVKGIFLITFLNVILTNPVLEMCNANCEGSDNMPVCVLDKSSVCFETFPSECIMESTKCIFQKDYVVMHANYCELNGFQCEDKPWPKFQSPPVEDILRYSNNPDPQESVEIVYKHIDNNKNGDENRYHIVEDPANKRDETTS